MPTDDDGRLATQLDDQPAADSALGSLDLPRRACDECRRMKIRCINKENPPCYRCRSMKLTCEFNAGPVTSRGGVEQTEALKSTNSRLQALEDNMGGVTQKLDDISTALHRIAALCPPIAPPSAAVTEPTFSPHSSTSIGSASSVAFAISDLPIPPASRPTTMRTSSLSASVSAGIPLRHEDDSEGHDPVEMAMTFEPFRHLTRLEEERRLAADGCSPGESVRKRKRSEAEPDDLSLDRGPIRDRGYSLANQKDPVSLGYCSEQEAKTLFDAFFKHAHPFLPILDPRVDTWESLRRRSPFVVTAILWVALRARDGCRQQSVLTQQCKDLAEMMARLTLFSPIATLETVQGLTLLTAWGEHGWRTCCHAMALAVDMRLYRCLQHLQETRLNSPREECMSERQQQVVAGARLWLAVTKQSYEMSYNHALPVQFADAGNERTMFKREFLDHPLSNLYDSRLVVSCEILEVRECIFRPYARAGTCGVEEMDSMLRKVNKGLETVYSYWLDYYRAVGLPSDHFLVNELGSQKAYTTVFSNSVAWYGVRTKNDVVLLSAERREWLASAMRSAAYALSSIGGGKQQKDSEYGNHNFHVVIVVTALYLIRMIELLPDVCNRYEVSLDMDKLLLKLPDYPAHPFGDLLSASVAKSRRDGVLPFTIDSAEAAAITPNLAEAWPTDTIPWMGEANLQDADLGSFASAISSATWPTDFELWISGLGDA